MTNVVLVVDDEKNILTMLRRVLEMAGYAVQAVDRGEAAVSKAASSRPDAILLDVKLPDIDGLEVLRRLRPAGYHGPVVMMSGHGTIETAVQATKLGAFDFLEKPISDDRILLVLENALRMAALTEENRALREEVEKKYRMVGRSPAFMELMQMIRTVSPTSARVLITGESGSGKELVARAVHERSGRGGAFVSLNCAAVPAELIESELFGHVKGAFTGAIADKQGKFTRADKGTLFLDEIGDMPLPMQAKLLRVLETGEVEKIGGADLTRVDVRVVAATNQDLERKVEDQTFRKDLLYRLNVMVIAVPALRDRGEDIPELVDYFLERFCADNGKRKKTISDEALSLLVAYPWPGNVRELKNSVERLSILVAGDEIAAEDISRVLPVLARAAPKKIPKPGSLKSQAADAERRLIMERLEAHAWQIAETARDLGLERSHLYKKMKMHGIERKRR